MSRFHIVPPLPLPFQVTLHKSGSSKDASTHEKTFRYFSQLDKKLRQRLFQVYQVDFEAFGYDAQPYL